MAVTPDGRTVYVVNLLSGTVTPIRTATNTALPPIRVGTDPRAIAITPDGKTAYVVKIAPSRGLTVTPIRTATNKALPPITVGRTYPQNLPSIAITPDGSTVYVITNVAGPAHPDAVTPIRTATNTALAPSTVGRGSCALAITPDGKTVYVANMSPGTVIPIQTATNTALAPIKVGRGACGIAVMQHGGRAETKSR